MNYKHYIYTAVAVLTASVAALSVSCTKIEDYPDGRISQDDLFTTDRKTFMYLNTCYDALQNKLYGMWYGNSAFMDAFTDNASDAQVVNNSASYQWYQGSVTPYGNPLESGNNGNWWQGFFSGIRYCNVFLANIDDAYVYSEGSRIKWTAEARTLRAFYYLQIIKRYGKAPISLEEYAADYDYSQVTFAPFSQIVKEVIIPDCEAALDVDDIYFGWRSGSSEMSRGEMNKAIACIVMSEAALYAASPLYNDGTVSWAEAADITKRAMDNLKAHGYELFNKTNSNFPGAYGFYFGSRSDVQGATDPETIFEIRNRTEMYKYHGIPTIVGAVSAGNCPSQELVDCFETIDGVRPILGYSDANHLQPKINPNAVLYDEAHPYANRDPRLDAIVLYNDATISTALGKVETGVGGAHEISSGNTRYTRTGYYLRKYLNVRSNERSNLDGYFKLYRYAEALLNYAEAAAEASSTVPEAAYAAVNEVRARAGMPDLPVGLSKEEFLERVRNERRVEFAFEDSRFYDVRRWQKLSETDRVVTGMRPTDNGYERFVVDTRNCYEDKFLLSPIPGDEVIRVLNYTGVDIQNPGW